MTRRRQSRSARATWPYVLVMLGGWGLIFGGIFFSHFLSSLPDVQQSDGRRARRRTSPSWMIAAG